MLKMYTAVLFVARQLQHN